MSLVRQASETGLAFSYFQALCYIYHNFLYWLVEFCFSEYPTCRFSIFFSILQKTYEFCRKVGDEQMDILCNIFEHPCQNIPQALTVSLTLYLKIWIKFLYPRHLCRRVYSFRLSVRPFVRSYVRSFVRNSVPFVEFASKFCVKVSQVVYISATTHQKAFIFGP